MQCMVSCVSFIVRLLRGPALAGRGGCLAGGVPPVAMSWCAYPAGDGRLGCFRISTATLG